MPLYNLRSLTADTYMIAKFSEDFEVESTYTLTAKGFSYLCDCPANSRSVVIKPCRHKLMMPALLPYADTEKFYDFDTKMFCTPLGDLLRPEADPKGREALPDAGEALRAEADSVLKSIDPSWANDGDDPALVGEAPGSQLGEGEAPPSPILTFIPEGTPMPNVTKQDIYGFAPPAQAPTIRRR